LRWERRPRRNDGRSPEGKEEDRWKERMKVRRGGKGKEERTSEEKSTRFEEEQGQRVLLAVRERLRITFSGGDSYRGRTELNCKGRARGFFRELLLPVPRKDENPSVGKGESRSERDCWERQVCQ